MRAITLTAFWRASISTFEGQVTVLGGILVLYVGLGSLAFPEGPDQAIFAWIGSVILDGGVPYRDGEDIKAPLTYYVYTLAQALFGRNELSIRVLDLAVTAGGCWLLRRLVLRVTDGHSFGANCAVIFFCLMYYGGGYADTAQPEGWGGLLILAAVVVMLAKSLNTAVRMVIAGVLIALATLIKPTFMIYLLLPCALVGTQAMTVTSVLLCAASFGVILTMAIVCLIRAQALGDFLDMLRYLYTTYVFIDRPSLMSGLGLLPENLVRFGLVLPYLMAPIGLKSIRKSQGDRPALLIGTWILLATATVLIQRRYWHDHWLPAAIALAAILGVGCSDLSKRYLTHTAQPLSWVRVFVAVAIVGALAVPAARAFSVNDQWLGYALGIKSHDDYITRVTEPFNEVPIPFNYNELRRLASYIDGSTEPDQRVIVWGWDVSLFVMSQRKSSTRFGVFQEMVTGGPLQDKFRATFLSEISSRPPDEIIIDTRGAWSLPPGTGWTLLDGFPEFKRFIDKGYSRKAVLGNYEVWTKRTSFGARRLISPVGTTQLASTSKFVDAVPLNRQVQQPERYGICLSVATLSNWMLTIGTNRVQPLVDLLRAAPAGAAEYLDET